MTAVLLYNLASFYKVLYSGFFSTPLISFNFVVCPVRAVDNVIFPALDLFIKGCGCLLSREGKSGEQRGLNTQYSVIKMSSAVLSSSRILFVKGRVTTALCSCVNVVSTVSEKNKNKFTPNQI
jgi:hypothetical protein